MRAPADIARVRPDIQLASDAAVLQLNIGILERFSGERNRSPQWLAQDLPFVHYCRQNRIGMLVDLVACRLEIDLMTHYELDSTQTLLRLVQAGHGWSIVTGLCLIRYAELLARHRDRVAHRRCQCPANCAAVSSRALGDLPAMLAEICQDIYRNDLVRKLTKIAPWFSEQAYTIDELQVICGHA